MYLDDIFEELKRLLDTQEGDANVMPIQDHLPRSASNDWAIRSAMREEKWKEARSCLVENILKGEDASSSICQQCRSNAAVVCCRDCLPYPFLLALFHCMVRYGTAQFGSVCVSTAV